MMKVNDVIGSMIQGGARHERKNGKVIFKTMKNPDPPWRYFGRDKRMNCALWKNIFYKYFGLIHSMCHQCYKIVIVPSSLNELLVVEKIMSKICREYFHCKCGIERRQIVDRKYGAYFYCRGKREADKRINKIRSLVPPNINVFTKTGCTEFELEHGPFDKWEITQEQIDLEGEINSKVEVIPKNPPQTSKDINRVHTLWKEFALKHDTVIVPNLMAY